MLSDVFVDDKKRKIYFYGPVDYNAAREIIIALQNFDETQGDIVIIMNSEGGAETDGYAIYDAITMCKNMVIIEGYGQISSITVAIFQAADIRRLAPNADLMIHDGTIGAGAEIKQNIIVEMADQIKRDNQRYYSILAGRSKLSIAKIEEACSKDTYYSAEEALTNGFCDEILVPQKKWKKREKKKK